MDGAVELIGANVLQDTLRRGPSGRDGVLHRDAVGPVDDQGLLPDGLAAQRRPADRLLRRRRRPAPAVLQGFLDAVAAGEAVIPLGRVYRMDQIVQAHRDMEAGTVGGKGVVLT